MDEVRKIFRAFQAQSSRRNVKEVYHAYLERLKREGLGASDEPSMSDGTRRRMSTDHVDAETPLLDAEALRPSYEDDQRRLLRQFEFARVLSEEEEKRFRIIAGHAGRYDNIASNLSDMRRTLDSSIT